MKKINRSNKKHLLLIASIYLALVLIMVMSVATFAWFRDRNTMDVPGFTVSCPGE